MKKLKLKITIKPVRSQNKPHDWQALRLIGKMSKCFSLSFQLLSDEPYSEKTNPTTYNQHIPKSDNADFMAVIIMKVCSEVTYYITLIIERLTLGPQL